MFIDSHCHLDFPEFQTRLPEVLANMAGVPARQSVRKARRTPKVV